jgi:hypothetical protein
MRKTLEAEIAEKLKAGTRPMRTAVHPFASLIEDLGGIAVSRGWPDFAVFNKDYHLKAVVEAKPDRDRWRPEEHQLTMLAALASVGFPSFVWSPAEVVEINRAGEPKQVRQSFLTDLLLSH